MFQTLIYIKVLNPEEHEQASTNEYDFDHPDAFDYDLLFETLKRLKAGKSVEIPSYNFNTHARDKHRVSNVSNLSTISQIVTPLLNIYI